MDNFKENINKEYDLRHGQYDKLWQIKLNDPDWLKNDGKGRVKYCADYIRSNHNLNGINKLLDVGCGRGTLAHFISQNFELYGIDISENAIFEANKVYSHAEQIDLDKEELPYDNNFFDFAVALDVLEHVYDPLALIRKIHKVLRYSGKLVLSTPNILYEKYLKDLIRLRRFPKTSDDPFPYDGGHIHFFTYRDVYKILQQSGFKATAIGPNKDRFDYEFKESTVWVMAEKMVEDHE
jgi:2-polyprenyl-3-methyl-5-hydroxy-6-metoxy-1,4-benzoquinol methylase